MNFLIGLAAGLFGGLVGLGGGVVMIPLMVGILKLEQIKAHGNSLAAIVCSGLVGAATYAWQGSVDIIAAVLLASAAVFTVRAGARYAGSLPEWKLKKAFGAFLLLVTLMMLIKPYLPHLATPATGWLKILTLVFAGAFTGFLSGMMGVGGGTIMVPAMVLLTGMPQYVAQGSSLLAMVPVGVTGSYTHWRLGSLDSKLLTGLIPGIIAGSILGGLLAHSIPEGMLRLLFAIVLAWSGVKYLRTRAVKPEEEEEEGV